MHAAYLKIKSRSPVEMGRKYIQSSSDDWNVALNESLRSIKMQALTGRNKKKLDSESPTTQPTRKCV